MSGFAREALDLADRHAGMLSLLGLAAVVAQTWRLWRQDERLAARIGAETKSVPALARTPRVSVLVAAWNEHDRIDAHIRSFLALTYPDIELVLCVGGADDSLQRARRYAGERVIVLEQRPGDGKQRALARCLERASGEIVYLTDADCVYSDDALLRLLAPLVEEGEQAATGGSRPLDDQMDATLPTYLWASDVVSSAHRPSYVEGLLGRNAAVSREALVRSGGLDFVAKTGTDYQLARRLVKSSVAIRHVHASVVPSEYPETLRTYRRKRSRWLRNLLTHGLRYRARQDVVLTLRTVATGTVMTLAPLAALVFGRGVLAVWSLLLTYAVFSKLRYVLFAARLHRWRASARLLAALIPLTLVDFAIWALSGLDFVDPRRRDRW